MNPHKRILMVLLTLTGLLLFGHSSGSNTNAATASLAQAQQLSVCGDVNGDGNVNISDAVYLIAYIFSGGQPPVCPKGGTITVVVTKDNGAPYKGLVVRLDGTDRSVTTDIRGFAQFANVAPGMASLTFVQPFAVKGLFGELALDEMILDGAATVNVVPNLTVGLQAKIEAKAEPVPVGFCDSRPWAIMGLVQGGIAPFVAAGRVGVYGSCPCTGTATAPLNPPPCPGSTIYAAGTLPPPQVWTVTSTTCLGGVGCDTPVLTATASVFGP